MIGFSLRKLGRVDEAMEYYQKVLAAYPDRTTTRQYLGEAFLQIGEPAKAKDQLAEIGKRCGTACEDYQLLADEIAKFEKQRGLNGPPDVINRALHAARVQGPARSTVCAGTRSGRPSPARSAAACG